MNNITARDLQVFVAGALGLIGFRALLRLPLNFISGSGTAVAVSSLSSLISSIALFIAIAILLGKPKALVWAGVYVRLSLLASIAVFVFAMLSHFNLLPIRGVRFSWLSVSEILVPVVLWMLLRWSDKAQSTE